MVDEKLSKIMKEEGKRQDAKDKITEMTRKPYLLNIYKEKSKDMIDQVILRALIKGTGSPYYYYPISADHISGILCALFWSLGMDRDPG